MRIDRIHVKNFKLFEDMEMTLHPQFTLLIGENGSGKTSILDALAIACGVWLWDVPDSKVDKTRRLSLTENHLRLTLKRAGDRSLFVEANETMVSASGFLVEDIQESWTDEISFGKRIEGGLEPARDVIRKLYKRASNGEDFPLPIIAYYGAGRGSTAYNQRGKPPKRSFEPARRWAAFYDCLSEQIRAADLKQWFWDETTERGNRKGKYRPGFEVVRRAIIRCIPGADDAWFDTDRKDIVLSIKGNAQPSSNLSAGQWTMLAMVADIAIKAVTQNNYLVPPDELTAEDEPIPRVLAETPGIVLIDELDVHLHPRWQRRVIEDLITTFPKIQFVATTHSPQVVGEIGPDQVRVLDGKTAESPWQSYGMDSNWLLKHLMHSDIRNDEVDTALKSIESKLESFELESAETQLSALRLKIGETPDTSALAAKIHRAWDLLGNPSSDPNERSQRFIDLSDSSGKSDQVRENPSEDDQA